MGCSNIPYRRPDCSVCGKEQGAFMGSSAWHPFDGIACSDECGEAARDALLKLEASEPYRRERNKLSKIQDKIGQMRFDAIAYAKEPRP